MSNSTLTTITTLIMRLNLPCYAKTQVRICIFTHEKLSGAQSRSKFSKAHTQSDTVFSLNTTDVMDTFLGTTCLNCLKDLLCCIFD